MKDKILWYEGGTPLTDMSYLHSYRGGSYGTRCNLQFSSRESSRWIMRADTEVDGLYMAGQDAWLPSIAGAMYGGLLGAIKVIQKQSPIGVLIKRCSEIMQQIFQKNAHAEVTSIKLVVKQLY